MGGIWEAGVKAVKRHLKRVLNDTPFTSDEFYTLLTQVQAVLNPPPLTPLSDSPDNLESLTPGHFINCEALAAIPEENYQDVPISRLTRYQHLRQMQQHLWSRWSKEYLHQLQQRTKWRFRKDLVILRDWPMERITDVH